MKNTLGELLCELGVAQESISETEDMKMYTSRPMSKEKTRAGE